MKKSELVIGQEATLMHRGHAGDRVRIDGYGYRKGRRYGDYSPSIDGTGVLVTLLGYQDGEPRLDYAGKEIQQVVQLRQLDPRTFTDIRAAEKAAYEARAIAEEDRQHDLNRQTQRLQEIREMLATFEIESLVVRTSYGTNPELALNVDQAERLLFALDTQGAQA